MGFLIETIVLVVFLLIAHVAIYFWTSKKSLKSIRERHVVVTGGSSGIGFWMAIHCVKLGAHVTIAARNVQNLESALQKIQLHRINENQKIQYLSLDLSKSYADVEKSLSELEAKIAPIYMLINSAGGAVCGRVDEMPVDDAIHMMNINYYATFYPTRYVLTKLKKAGEGIITITGSQCSLLGIYGYGAYAAAKFALRGLAETISMEVANTKISITLALPADTGTIIKIFNYFLFNQFHFCLSCNFQTHLDLKMKTKQNQKKRKLFREVVVWPNQKISRKKFYMIHWLVYLFV